MSLSPEKALLEGDGVWNLLFFLLLKESINFFCLFLFCRTPWKKCCFSGDGEYIVAGSARQHALYIWEKSIGNLVKILHGTRGELLLDVAVSAPSFHSILSE